LVALPELGDGVKRSWLDEGDFRQGVVPVRLIGALQ
jgi:hypothetical protein